MAGGKETPRQKMIGMMYLVLTALLALNVSKQVIAAFITLNDKVEVSTNAIESKVEGIYQGFDNKITTLKATGGDVKLIKEWQAKALEVREEAAKAIDFLIKNSNDMIKEAEGKDWIKETVDINGKKYATELKSLHDIQNFDNYDIPTNKFITAGGGTPKKPNKTGQAIRETLITYRNTLCEKMANYTKGKKKYTFKAPKDASGLKAAYATANPEDTARINQIYNILGYPETLHNHDGEEVAWVASLFDHAPIVAAAAMFAALRSDVRNAEAIASEHMLDKVEVQMFNFNKIEPLAFASKGYINQGDSINLNVMIAAYDSTENNPISYGMDEDTANIEKWVSTDSERGIVLSGAKPGPHKVKGIIKVKQKGEWVSKPWEFNYSVGAPMGVVAQPEMRILYWGYDNVVEGTASGFPADKVRLSGSGCSLSSKGKGQYVAKVSRGTRKAKISVSGTRDDGSSVSLGSFEFECRPMPPATVYFGKTQMGGTSSYAAARGQSGIRVGYDPAVPLKGVKFTISGGMVKVDGVPGTGRVLAGGRFDSKAKSIL
ncbi:MAG TPA: hypothetical protein EYG85_12205, partial [Crocinitomix sp.]|nr:hypothetical protein [Crocinitomix sp.]